MSVREKDRAFILPLGADESLPRRRLKSSKSDNHKKVRKRDQLHVGSQALRR
jgi:hypothetical protein